MENQKITNKEDVKSNSLEEQILTSQKIRKIPGVVMDKDWDNITDMDYRRERKKVSRKFFGYDIDNPYD